MTFNFFPFFLKLHWQFFTTFQMSGTFQRSNCDNDLGALHLSSRPVKIYRRKVDRERKQIVDSPNIAGAQVSRGYFRRSVLDVVRASQKRTSSSHVDTGSKPGDEHRRALDAQTRTHTHTYSHAHAATVDRATTHGWQEKGGGEKKNGEGENAYKRYISKTIPTHAKHTHIYIDTHALTQRYQQHTPDAKTMRSRGGGGGR